MLALLLQPVTYFCIGTIKIMQRVIIDFFKTKLKIVAPLRIVPARIDHRPITADHASLSPKAFEYMMDARFKVIELPALSEGLPNRPMG
jgi:hypothetical protein